MNRSHGLVALLLVLALGGCGTMHNGVNNSPSTTPPSSVDQSPQTTTGPAPAPVTSTVTVTAAPQIPDATLDSLLYAQIPSLCDMPALQLAAGEAPPTRMSDGTAASGSIYLSASKQPIYVLTDLAGLGHLQLVGGYRCGIANSGSYLDYIVAVDQDGTTLGTLRVADLTGGGVTSIKSLELEDGVPVLHWWATDQPGNPGREGSNLLSWDDGRLVASS